MLGVAKVASQRAAADHQLRPRIPPARRTPRTRPQEATNTKNHCPSWSLVGYRVSPKSFRAEAQENHVYDTFKKFETPDDVVITYPGRQLEQGSPGDESRTTHPPHLDIRPP
jgi:hypothetical protein